MSDSKRSLLGWSLVAVGIFTLALGIWFNHYANFPKIETVTFPTEEAATFVAGDVVTFERASRIVDKTPTPDFSLSQATVDLKVTVNEFGWVPRGCLLGSADTSCLPWFTLGHLVALAGSQLLLLGLAISTILGHKMTWARAAFAAFLSMFELVILLGTVASEWLNLAQGPLNWTSQRIAVEVPKFLVLGNDVSISWSAVKDFVSINYNLATLTLIIIFAMKIQEWGKPLPEPTPAEDITSPYGRTLVKGAKNGDS